MSLTDVFVRSRQLPDLLKVLSGYTFVSTAYVFPYPDSEDRDAQQIPGKDSRSLTAVGMPPVSEEGQLQVRRTFESGH